MRKTPMPDMENNIAAVAARPLPGAVVIIKSKWRWLLSLKCTACHKDYTTVVYNIGDIWHTTMNRKVCGACGGKKK